MLHGHDRDHGLICSASYLLSHEGDAAECHHSGVFVRYVVRVESIVLFCVMRGRHAIEHAAVRISDWINSPRTGSQCDIITTSIR